jgi:hypothetical protein
MVVFDISGLALFERFFYEKAIYGQQKGKLG